MSTERATDIVHTDAPASARVFPWDIETHVWTPADREAALNWPRPAMAPAWLKTPDEGELVLIVTCLHSLMGPAFQYLCHWLYFLTGRYPLRHLVAGGGFAFATLDEELKQLLRQPQYAIVHGHRVSGSQAAVEAIATHITQAWVIGHAGSDKRTDECIELSFRLGLDKLESDARNAALQRKLGSAVDNLSAALQTYVGSPVPGVGWLVYLEGNFVRRASGPLKKFHADNLVIDLPDED